MSSWNSSKLWRYSYHQNTVNITVNIGYGGMKHNSNTVNITQYTSGTRVVQRVNLGQRMLCKMALPCDKIGT